MCGWRRESCSANVCSKSGPQFSSFPPLSLLDINHDDDQRPGMRFSISLICPRCLQIPNMQQFCWKFCYAQMENSAIEKEPSASSLDHSFRIIWISSWSNTFHHLSPSCWHTNPLWLKVNCLRQAHLTLWLLCSWDFLWIVSHMNFFRLEEAQWNRGGDLNFRKEFFVQFSFWKFEIDQF